MHGKHGVGGSNPSSPTKTNQKFGGIAQLVEHVRKNAIFSIPL